MDPDQLLLDGFEANGAALCDVSSISEGQLRVRELAMWCKHQTDLIARRSASSRGSESFLFAQAVKLGEEVGELHAELLGFANRQRADKAGNFSRDSLAGELADVTICVAILAELVGVDLSRALAGKMATINQRSEARHVAHHVELRRAE